MMVSLRISQRPMNLVEPCKCFPSYLVAIPVVCKPSCENTELELVNSHLFSEMLTRIFHLLKEHSMVQSTEYFLLQSLYIMLL
jgi:hypothetical protein